MRFTPNKLPTLERRLELVERRIHRTQKELKRRIRRALMPLDIQEDIGISNVNGDTLVMTRNDRTFERIERILTSEGLVFDWAETSTEGIGFLTLAKYRLIIYDQSRRSWKITGLIRYLNRYLDHIRIVALVRDQSSGENALKCGAFQYLIGPNFDEKQLQSYIASIRVDADDFRPPVDQVMEADPHKSKQEDLLDELHHLGLTSYK